jgi:hypothetical protein
MSMGVSNCFIIAIIDNNNEEEDRKRLLPTETEIA